MKTTLQKVRDGIAAVLQGRTVEEIEDARRQEAVCAAVGRFLESNPDWKPAAAVAPAGQPVTDSKQKAIRIMKTLGAGAGGFTPHLIDEVALARARAKCREIVAADPAGYSYIIESAPIKGTND